MTIILEHPSLGEGRRKIEILLLMVVETKNKSRMRSTQSLVHQPLPIQSLPIHSSSATETVEKGQAVAQRMSARDRDGRNRDRDIRHSDHQSLSGSAGTEFPLLQAGSSVLLILIIYSIGWKSSILILLSTTLLLLNPWIRILLELPSTSSVVGKSSLSRFDPAYYLSSFHLDHESETKSEEQDKSSEPSPMKSSSIQRERKFTLSVLPPAVRDRLRITVPLIVRDFVKYWYDPLTFAHPTFPNEASATIEHLCGSVYLRVKKKRTVDVASNLLLTSSSVILSALRARRSESTSQPKPSTSSSTDPQPPSANPSLPPIHSWNSTSSRIQSLRSSLQKFLSIHLPNETSSSILVTSVLTEILTKQLWGVIQIIGDPDWINRKIVESSQKQEDSGLSSNVGLGLQKELGSEAIIKSPQLNVDPAADKELLLKAQREANLPFNDEEQARSRSRQQQQRQPQPQEQMKTHPSSLQTSNPSSSSTPSSNPSLSNNIVTSSSSNVNLPTKSSSTDPLTSLGNLGLSALGSVGRVAGKTVDVLEGAVDEVGNTLMGGEATMPQASRNRDSGEHLAQRRKPVSYGFDQDETIQRPPSNLNSDLPSGDFREPQLPESLRNSMKDHSNNYESDNGRRSIEGYEIREPIREPRAPPTLPPRTPTLSSSTTFNHSDFSSLSSVLSREDAETYDRFESFLENQSSREDQSLLRLHTQLDTLTQISNMSSPDEPTFRTDALAILEKAGMLLSKDSDIKREVESTLERLQIEGNGNLRSLEGLKIKVDEGLRRCYHTFCERQQGKRNQAISSNRLSAPVTPSNSATSTTNRLSSTADTSSSSIQRSNSPGFNYVARGSAPKPQPEPPVPLNYTPRKKSSNFAPAVSELNQVRSISSEENPPVAPSRAQTSADQVAGSERTSIEGRANVPETSTPTSTSTPVRVSSPSPMATSQKLDKALSSHQAPAQSPSVSSSPAALSLEVSVTDVSPTSNGPNSLVDPKSLELMVAVEGMAASGGGFVLVRRWVEFENLDLELRRSSLPRSTIPQLPNLRSKAQTSMSACQLIEGYLGKLLSNPNLIHLEVTKRFVDKTRAGAGAETESIRSKGGPKAFIGSMGAFGGTLGRTVAIGASSVGAAVGNVGKTAGQNMGLGMEKSRTSSTTNQAPSTRNSNALTSNGFSNFENPSSLSITSSRSSSPTGLSPNLDAPNSSVNDAQFSSKQTIASPQLDVDISAQDLDALLSAVFSVADEAFDLSGGWTFRRGMLRVLEQIVRASYGGTIINAFNHTSQALSSESLGNHLEGLTDSFWPIEKDDGGAESNFKNDPFDISKRVWDSTPSPERTLEEREKTSKEARMVVLSYTPTQAAFLLGPGGKTSCEKALATIHGEIENPITSLDVALTIVLKILEISCE